MGLTALKPISNPVLTVSMSFRLIFRRNFSQLTCRPQPVMQSIKNTIAENFGGPAHQLAPAEHQFSLNEVPDLSSKVAVVTGGSEGIGFGCTHTLLSHNISKVFILSVRKEVVDGAFESIRSELGEDAAKKAKWIQCDLVNWRQVVDVAKQIADSTDRLDIMINNAGRGIMTAQTTDYGVDLHMALNHMGHVVLNSHLLPLMKKTAQSGNTVRIVTLGSNAHQGAPSDTSFSSLNDINKDHSPNGQYGVSKLASILYARYLSRHLTPQYPKILANSVHPGVVATKQSTQDIHEPYPLGGYGVSVLLNPFKKDQFQGAVSAMYAATKTEKSGEYICPPAIPEPGSDLAQNVQLGEQLMKLTREVVTQKTRQDSVEKGCPMKDY